MEPPVGLGAAAVQREAVRRLGPKLVLLSLGILFAAAMVGSLVVRLRTAPWPLQVIPGCPLGSGWPRPSWA